MYYKYKSKKGNGGFFKFLLITVIACTAVFFAYKYRANLAFWKYNYNKLDSMAEGVDRNKGASERIEKLNLLLEKCIKFRDEKPVSPDPFLVSGRVYFLLGEAYLGRSFGSTLTDQSFLGVDDKAKSAFTEAIKYLKKGDSLSSGKSMSMYDRLFLAKSAYYISYYPPDQILAILDKIENPEEINFPDDVYFYALMLVKNNAADEGVRYLQKKNLKDDYSKLVLAAAYAEAKQFTNAISEYRSLLSSSNTAVARSSALNLGRIYFSQSLYQEAVTVLDTVVSPQETDKSIRELMEKSLLMINDPVKAKLFAPIPEIKPVVK